jgi:cysteine desulfurase
VLTALGRSRQQATASIRFSLGRPTTATDIDQAIAIVTRTVQDLRGTLNG